MKSYMEEFTGHKNIQHLKRSLEEAAIIKTGMKLVLMNPYLNSECKGNANNDEPCTKRKAFPGY